jgi:molybdopterin-containing oxidoreductase family iron-sulfur binding subunit
MSSMKTKSDRRPKYWRSLAELEGDSEFQEFVQREFPSPTEQTPLSSQGRRRFVQLMGASFALAGCRWKEEKVLPYSERPDGMIPGVPNFYSTMMEIAGVATGLVVKSFDGRPIKIEGNPADSITRGGTSTYHQASVLGLYDPDRSMTALQKGQPSDNQKFDAALLSAFAEASQNGGAGFAVLGRASSSPTLARLKRALTKQAPQMKWVTYEPTDSSGPREGVRLAFG